MEQAREKTIAAAWSSIEQLLLGYRSRTTYGNVVWNVLKDRICGELSRAFDAGAYAANTVLEDQDDEPCQCEECVTARNVVIE